MPTPAGRKYHQAFLTIAPLTNASSSVLPHEADEGSPRPRNERVVSVRMEIGTASVAVGQDQPTHIGEDVTGDQMRVAGPERPRPVNEKAAA